MTLVDFQRLVDGVQIDKGLTKLTKINFKAFLNSVLDYVDYTYHNQNNIRLDKIKLKQGKPSDRIKYLEPEEIQPFLNSIYANLNETYAMALEVQLLTGMRIGEVRALTELDWLINDTGPNQIRTNKSIERRTNRVSVVKNKFFNRTIESSDRIDDIFRQRIQTNHLLFGDDASFIFTSKLNGPITYTYLASTLPDINPHYSTHMLRHTHISLLAQNGVSLKYTMNRVGHSDPKTTLKIYTHVSDTLKQKEAEKLNNLF
ncbi:site-specific integrase [Eremococcus coleocola]|uniref:site-specific integrase n=1 Tax=Eremococcus coleocola TaxID=88132 RepID=UPI0004090F60|nr:site-specific integrase [Eremococcus coleocola]